MKTLVFTLVALIIVPLSTSLDAQTRTIAGQVTDSRTGKPLSVGQVTVQETGFTDRLRADGVFVLHVPTQEVTIEITSLGYIKEELVVSIVQELVRVDLEVDALRLGRLIVSGRGTEMERRHLAQAITSLDSDHINRVPASTWEEMLHGKVVGLQVKQSSAAPGGANLLRLRGISSIFGSNTPIYVLDGVVVSDARIDGGMNAISLAEGRNRIAATSADGLPNRIADLNPNDIASIEILRGAAATVMFGSRGANGAVIIKTKRGGEY